jgi:hypothetical protein
MGVRFVSKVDQDVIDAARTKGLEILNMGIKMAEPGFVRKPGEKADAAAERLLLIAIEKLKS